MGVTLLELLAAKKRLENKTLSTIIDAKLLLAAACGHKFFKGDLSNESLSLFIGSSTSFICDLSDNTIQVFSLNPIFEGLLLGVMVFAVLTAVTERTANAGGSSTIYMEKITVSVECDNASLNLMCQLISENETLIHYPSEVNMTHPHLVECTSILVVFNVTSSRLTFFFRGTDTATAESKANTIKPSIEAGFGVTFIHFNTTAYMGSPSIIHVIYTGEGVNDIASFTGTLETRCLANDLAGFSDALQPLVAESADSTVSLLAANLTDSWGYCLTATYATTIPVGLGNHTVNILELLGTTTLAPSPYAEVEGVYVDSNVTLNVNSSTDITFVSCTPEETTTPSSRGWRIPSHGPTTKLSATFHYGDDPSAVEALTFKFAGTVIPEFNITTLLLTLTAAASAVLLLRRRLAILQE